MSLSIGGITATIPGEPVAQGRGRVAVIAGHARVYDPAKSRNWKATAQEHLRRAMEASGYLPLRGPLALQVEAVFTMPASRHLRKGARPSEWHTKRPDLDNVLKSLKDAASGVVWLDDRQVVAVSASKRTGAQGEPPRVEVRVTPVDGQP